MAFIDPEAPQLTEECIGNRMCRRQHCQVPAARAELRYRVTENFGVVVFLDAGSAFDSVYPDPSEQALRLGAGPGLRYYTPIGPLRLDVGFPIERRDHVDDLFDVYLSIGQAF